MMSSGTRNCRSFVLILATLAAFAACSDSPTTQRALAPAPASMAIVSGNGQAGPAGAELPEPVIVRVLDNQGQPLPGQIVNFHVTEGEGSVFAGT